MKSIKAYSHWKYYLNKHRVYANPNTGKRIDKIFNKKIVVFKNTQDAKIRNNAD
ncbi:MAG: hypothetical protein ACRC2O_08460 [Chitinophagaceae bacterium]